MINYAIWIDPTTTPVTVTATFLSAPLVGSNEQFQSPHETRPSRAARLLGIYSTPEDSTATNRWAPWNA